MSEIFAALDAAKIPADLLRDTDRSVQERIDEKLSGLDRRMAAQESIEDKLASLDKRLGDQAKAQQEKKLSQKQEIEISLSRGRRHGIER